MMKIIVILFISVLVLTGCDVIQTPMAESHLETALAEGDLNKQLETIDKLSTLNPKKYQSLADQKEKLLPDLFQIIDNPKNIQGISDLVLKEIVEFAPNYEPLSYARQYLSNKKRINDDIKKSRNQVEAVKVALREKLANTPSHVETYITNMQLSQIEPYFILSDFAKRFIRTNGDKTLNGYQVEAIAKSFSDIYLANIKLIEAISAFESINQSDQKLDVQRYLNENQDIAQIVLWLYKKQLLVSFKLTVEQNKHLLSLLNNQYGRKNIDDIWVSIVEPAAKKAVMEAKESHLNVLNIMSAKLTKMSSKYPRFSQLYVENDNLEKLMLSLLWPSDGLVNFEQTAKTNTRILWNEVNRMQQL
jgi:hypothetical protein